MLQGTTGRTGHAVPVAWIPNRSRMRLVGSRGGSFDLETDRSCGQTQTAIVGCEEQLVVLLEQAGRGKLRLDRLITDTLPADSIAEAFARLDRGDMSVVGVVFDWPDPG